MRKRIKIIRSEIVSSPEINKQVKLAEAHDLEKKGHTIVRPTVRRRASEFFIAAPRGCDMHLTLGANTI